jgi:hypothetical protein
LKIDAVTEKEFVLKNNRKIFHWYFIMKLDGNGVSRNMKRREKQKSVTDGRKFETEGLGRNLGKEDVKYVLLNVWKRGGGRKNTTTQH